MSVTIQLSIEDVDSATVQALFALPANAQFILQAATDAVGDACRDHFVEREHGAHATAEGLGAQPSGFWSKMHDGVRTSATATEGTVAMPREMALKIFGGTARPQNGSTYLTLAAIAQAYGKRVADFPGLHFGIAFDTKFGVFRPAMVMDEKQLSEGKGANRKHTALGRDRERTVVYFWLTTSATLKPDRDALPSPAVLAGCAEIGADEAVKSLLKRSGGTP